MKTYFPPQPDFDIVKTLSFSKKSMTHRIYQATEVLDKDCPEFARYWTDVSPSNRDLFIANVVERLFN